MGSELFHRTTMGASELGTWHHQIWSNMVVPSQNLIPNHPKSSNVQPKLNIHPNMHSKTIPCCHVHPIVHWLFPLTLPPLLAFIGLRLPQDLKSAASVVPIHHQHTGLALLGPRNSKGPGADRLKMGSPIFQNSNFSGNPFFLKSNVSEWFLFG